MHYTVVDTRSYPEGKTRNPLLFHVSQLISARGLINHNLAEKQLNQSVAQVFKQNAALTLSAALALSASQGQYNLLLKAIDHYLSSPEDKSQVSFVLFPLVLVAGSKKAQKVTLNFKNNLQLSSLIEEGYPELAKIKWYHSLISVEDFKDWNAFTWYKGRKEPEELFQRLVKESHEEKELPEGGSVSLFFLLGYGNLAPILFQEERKVMMPLMTFWNQFFMAQGITPFANPLPLMPPLKALSQGAFMRKKIDLDIFLTNTIRAIKLLGLRVCVVIATKEGGTLEFRLQAWGTEEHSYFYSWHLSSSDPLEMILEDVFSFLQSVQVENVCLLKRPLNFSEVIPSYCTATKEAVYNPILP